MTECYADTMLIEALVPPKQGYNHKHSCSQVEREMQHGRLKDGFAVGIVDNDKKQLSYLKKFEQIDEVPDFLSLWKHKDKYHYLIFLCPALEGWIIEVCKLAGISVFQPDMREFMQLTKSQTSSNNMELVSLFKKISKRNDLEPVRKLKNWIDILIKCNYNVEIKDLKNA